MCKFRLLRKNNNFNQYHFPNSGLKRLTISSLLLVGLMLSFGTVSEANAQITETFEDETVNLHNLYRKWYFIRFNRRLVCEYISFK